MKYVMFFFLKIQLQNKKIPGFRILKDRLIEMQTEMIAIRWILGCIQSQSQKTYNEHEHRL